MDTTGERTVEDDDDHNGHTIDRTPLFPPWIHILTLVVLLPAVVAGSNQLVFIAAPPPYYWWYAWLAFTTAVLSWCIGRYLQPIWLRLLVFAWGLALLDLLTIAACISGSADTAYALIAAQASLLVVWSVLSSLGWQYRLPAALVAIAMLIAFAGIFDRTEWSILIAVTTALVALVCLILRWKGFKLQRIHATSLSGRSQSEATTLQFGVRHLLIWSAAIAPLLIVTRGIEYVTYRSLGVQSALPALLIALSLAIVAFTAIWAVLGAARWFVRIGALIAVPGLLAFGLEQYWGYVKPPGWSWPRDPILYVFAEMEGDWSAWLGLLTALLAALLLFLRASDYRVMRHTRISRDGVRAGAFPAKEHGHE